MNYLSRRYGEKSQEDTSPIPPPHNNHNVVNIKANCDPFFFEVRNLLGPKNTIFTIFRHLEFSRFIPREWLVNQEFVI